MAEHDEQPTEDDYVAGRLILNMLIASAHDGRAEIALKTGIDLERLKEILSGSDYPDWYEIAAFERAYRRRLWPKQSP